MRIAAGRRAAADATSAVVISIMSNGTMSITRANLGLRIL
eukprot:COSAG04_NODE_11680_length_694_cov_1.327731_1_plen_39_part_10